MTSDLRISASNEREWCEAVSVSEHRPGSDARPAQGHRACPRKGRRLALVLPPRFLVLFSFYCSTTYIRNAIRHAVR